MISVIVPVYNTAAFLERALISIFIQSYQQIMVMICDDGSMDSSAAITDDYILLDDRCVAIHKSNSGLSESRKSGFSLSQDKFVIFIDSDDYIDSNMLERLFLAINEHDAELSICGYYRENSYNTEPQYLPYHNVAEIKGRTNIVKLYIEPLIGYSNSGVSVPGFLCIRLHKRSLIQKSFFASERIYYLEDHVFDLLYADQISTIAIVNAPLYHYCINANSLTNKYRSNQWGMLLKLYHFYKGYILKQKFDNCNDRLINYLSSVFYASIDNAVKSGCYSSFLNDMKVILSSREMNDVWLAAKMNRISPMKRFTIFCCRLHSYRLLYWVRKWRLSLNKL